MGVDVHYGVTFNFDSAIVCTIVIFETCFYCNKDLLIASTNHMYFYIIVLFPLTAILQ